MMRTDRRSLLKGITAASLFGATGAVTSDEAAAEDSGDCPGTEWLTNAYRLRKATVGSAGQGEGEFDRVVGNVILSHLSADARIGDTGGLDPRKRVAGSVLEGGLREGAVEAALAVRGEQPDISDAADD